MFNKQNALAMKTLSSSELLNLTGGLSSSWSDCEMVIIAGNQSENWTDQMWEQWLEAFDRLC